MLDLADALGVDPEKPRYHVAPRTGWINDPNGPVLYKDEYHLFYQHLESACEWEFGIVWGHAVSRDLVFWEHQPPALTPTPGKTDADGCFSGCCVLDTDGTPTILYTGARLRDNGQCRWLPGRGLAADQKFVETQCTAVPAEGSRNDLRSWRKVADCIPKPPSDMQLTGWRDPYIWERGGNGRPWVMLLGSGIKGKGGCVLIYESYAESLKSGWEYKSVLCQAKTEDTGYMWECPFLLKLTPQPIGNRRATNGWWDNVPSWLKKIYLPQQPDHTYLLCVSPDAPYNPVLYWLGNYNPKSTKFLLEGAKGPFRLDLGDVLYAPNVLTDKEGRHILWGWLQETREQKKRKGKESVVEEHTYAGCLSVPRVLNIHEGRLTQVPLPGLEKLRQPNPWQQQQLEVHQERPIQLLGVTWPALDIELVMKRGTATSAGLLFESWKVGGKGSAAVLFDWVRGTLEVVFENGGIPSLVKLDPADGLVRVGGQVAEPADGKEDSEHTLRILLDHSCIEVFHCGSGKVLSTRIYRGSQPSDAAEGVYLVSHDGTAKVVSLKIWQVGSIWAPEKIGQPSSSGQSSSNGGGSSLRGNGRNGRNGQGNGRVNGAAGEASVYNGQLASTGRGT